ncbi:enoyl-CoA hydratase/isomerase family protein [Desulfococcaceae bacterium HSG9]|nr:enoyl-CoA hydratase/isomerase family protein [Desulfococcaceae bacterium HSG9]
MIRYTMDKTVAVITLDNGENVFNPPFLEDFMAVLDKVETDTDARTLIVKSAHSKIFSNGIDLEWLGPMIQQSDWETSQNFFHTLNSLFKRLITYPLITIAAITGHAFAGGAILCCAFDFRWMRSDRGFFCFPEVDLGIPFLPGMNALLQKAIPKYKLEEMQYTGARLTAEECEQHHIIMKACHGDQLMAETLAFAHTLNKNRAIIAEMKQRLNKEIVRVIDVEDKPYIESNQFNIV